METNQTRISLARTLVFGGPLVYFVLGYFTHPESTLWELILIATLLCVCVGAAAYRQIQSRAVDQRAKEIYSYFFASALVGLVSTAIKYYSSKNPELWRSATPLFGAFFLPTLIIALSNESTIFGRRRESAKSN